MRPAQLTFACLVLAALGVMTAPAQVRAAQEDPTSSAPTLATPAGDLEPGPTGAGDSEFTSPHSTGLTDSAGEPSALWPHLSSATLTWFGVLVVLLLTLQMTPILSLRNLDGLMLALTALLLAFRNDYELLGAPGTSTRQSLAYSLLAVMLLYWCLRGFFTLRARLVPAPPINVSEGAMVVLIAAVLTIALTHIATGPLGDAARDGLVGGLCLAETGQLPYGDAPSHDMQSPALYIVNAALVKAAPPALVRPPEGSSRLLWSDRADWQRADWWAAVDKTPIRALHATMLVLTLAALLVIGARLHNLPTGLTLVAIFTAFPGALECFNRPDILLPTMLLAWSLAFALVPAGGLLAILFIVFAGLAWPWAWLALPVMLGYFIRQGWNGVGATAGLIAGLALCLVGTSQLVQPALPYHAGAIGHAGRTPTHVARLDDGGLEIAASRPAETVDAGWSQMLWSYLLGADSTTVDGTPVRDIVADSAARERLQQRYRATLRDLPEATRFWASLRTVLEYTWLPRVPAEKPQTALDRPPQPLEGAWKLWADETGDEDLWVNIRRGVKGIAVLAALLFGVGLLRLRQPLAYKLVGAVAATLTLAMLSTEMSAATNWAWILPALLAVYAANGISRETGRPPVAAVGSPRGAPPNVPSGTAPRISVNN